MRGRSRRGEVENGEEPLEVARRESAEELGSDPPEGPVSALGEIRQPGCKRVIAWALQGDFDAETVQSNTLAL